MPNGCNAALRSYEFSGPVIAAPETIPKAPRLSCPNKKPRKCACDQPFYTSRQWLPPRRWLRRSCKSVACAKRCCVSNSRMSKRPVCPQSRHLGRMQQGAASHYFHLGQSGCQLWFRICLGGHAGAYGAGVVKDIFWILNK